MSVELGHFALILAAVVALIQAGVPLAGAARGRPAWVAIAPSAAVAQFALVAIAFGCLVGAYVRSDFSVLNVALNSHSAKPLLYKVSGAWGNHEGSMLLWVLILVAFGAAVALFGRNLPAPFKARVLSIQAATGLGFYAFILLTSNPFARLDPAPVDGQGLNPLLQDPGLALHPPFLYLGYVGFSMAYSFALAALIEGRVDPSWARWVRPWTLAAWVFLTAGIGLGAWWAYYELGWGGWWYWDPVENASLIPWLAGTALVHSAIVVERRDALKGWTVLLAIVTFAFSLIGTFLVRSGVLTSVHAFAQDPARGVFILALLIVYVGGGLALFAWRGPRLREGGMFQPISREGSLLFNNLVLSVAAATVLLGTLYPLLLDAVGGAKVSVGPPFFNRVFVPLMLPLVLAMAIGPLLPWKRGELLPACRRLAGAAVAAVLAVALVLALTGDAEPMGTLGIALAAWLLAGTVTELAGRIRLGQAPIVEASRRLAGLPRAALGMTLAHAGLAVAIAGMTAAAVWQEEKVVRLRPGEALTIAGYEAVFEGIARVPGPNFVAERATFVLRSGGSERTRLYPEKRRYAVEGRETTEAAIRTRLAGDVYLAIGDEAGGSRVVRAYFNPLVAWIWGGVGLMAVGGAVSLSDRRLRLGVPAVRRPAAALPGRPVL